MRLHITETVLRDGRFLYTVMEVCWEPEYPKLTVGQWYFPPALLENPGSETAEYYRRLTDGLQLSVRLKCDCAQGGAACKGIFARYYGSDLLQSRTPPERIGPHVYTVQFDLFQFCTVFKQAISKA